MKSEASAATKATDKQLVKVQTLLLDSLAPLTSILETHNNGESLDLRGVIRAVRSGITLIGNANCHLLHLRRERIVSDMNKALLPIVGDDDNFKEAAPLLFGTEFAKKSKEMVEQVKARRSAITKKTRAKASRFFRRGPPKFGVGGASTGGMEGAEPRTSTRERGHTRWKKANHKDRKDLVHVCPKDICPNKSNGAHGHSTSSADRQPAGGRKIEDSHKGLEGVNRRPVDGKQHTGLSGGFALGTPAECTTAYSTESIKSGGGTGTSGQRSHNRNTQPSGQVLLLTCS